ncbi:hypothetical protein BGZ73_002905 [Actinomortierella ambigua]|nr:hypothetical protein BGZ73_002905 [Actinomortierella ambigua]
MCPICQCDFDGDLSAFERHVNNHLDGIEDENNQQQVPQMVANNNDRRRPGFHRHLDDRDTESRALVLELAAEMAVQADQMAADRQLAYQLQSEDEQKDQSPNHQHTLSQGDKDGTDAETADVEMECEIPTCGAVVRLSDMQQHMDHHLAQRLAQDIPSWGRQDIELVQQGNSLTVRLRQDNGTRKDISVKQRHVDALDRAGANVAKKAKLQLDDQRTSTSMDYPHRQWSAPPLGVASPTSSRPAGRTTMHGFLRQPSTSMTSSLSSKSTSSEPGRQPRTFFTTPRSSEACSGMLIDLIPRLATLLQAAIDANATHEAYLADPSVAFCPGDQTDRGWGCGYRNLQMMLSYIVQQPSTQPTPVAPSQYDDDVTTNSSSSSSPSTTTIDLPTILDLQRQLEYAWHTLKIDPEGAAQLKHKVVSTRKWIGTTETWSILTSLGVRSQILDFHQPTGPNDTHPALFEAVLQYFQSPADTELQPPIPAELMVYGSHGKEDGRMGDTTITAATAAAVAAATAKTASAGRARRTVIQTRKPPLYLQHQGHSRTIVGIEVLRPGLYTLLVFDPGRKVPQRFMQVPPMPSSTTASTNTQSTQPGHSSGSTSYHRSPPQKNKKNDIPEGVDRSLLRSFRLWLAAGYTKSQYQLLGISGFVTPSSSTATTATTRKNKLSLLTANTALSAGWDAQERLETKYPISKRVP